jgi:hypothetical protein
MELQKNNTIYIKINNQTKFIEVIEKNSENTKKERYFIESKKKI